MTAKILHGRPVAERIIAESRERSDRLCRAGIVPKLAFVSVESSRPAELFLRRLSRLGSRLHVTVQLVDLQSSGDANALESAIHGLNHDNSVDGILVQMPLPKYMSDDWLATAIDPRKDVDGITAYNAGKLYLGIPGQRPSTAAALWEMVLEAEIPVPGCHAVIVGRSNVVGHPVSELLLQHDATLTVTHRATSDLKRHTRMADLLIVAAGEPGLIGPDMIKPGVVVLDAGINSTVHGVVGDVEFEACSAIARAITPVPGGIGPITNAVLMRHVIDSAEQRTI